MKHPSKDSPTNIGQPQTQKKGPSGTISAEQVKMLGKARFDAGADLGQFLRAFNIYSLNQLPADRIDDAFDWIHHHHTKGHKP